jgi:hypothetical protein
MESCSILCHVFLIKTGGIAPTDYIKKNKNRFVHSQPATLKEHQKKRKETT